MKKFFLFFFIFIALKTSATRYYVSSSQGNNNNNGTSTATPWQTLSKVNISMNLFNPGDTISFRKGDVFAGTLTITKSGTITNNLVFNSYGTGDKPLFSGTGNTISTLVYAITKTYIVIDGINITDPTFPPDPDRLLLARIQAGITLDQCTYCKVQNCEMSLVGTGVYTAQGGYHDINNNTIYNLRMIVNDTGAFPKNINDYGANSITLNSSNNSVTHNTFYGAWARSYDFTFDGGAIEFYNEGSGASNNFIAYNTMYDNNGISETGGKNGIALCNNNVFVYNKLINNRDVFYFHGSQTGWQFYNNAVVETFNNRLNPTSTISGDNGTITQIDIQNNVFQIGIGGTVLNISRLNANHTNNIYKISGSTSLGFTLGANEVNTSAAFWTNTTNSDPVLWNYAPLNPGLLIGTGINVGLSTDFAGNPVSNPPDISILQSVVPPTPPPTPVNKLVTRSRFIPTHTVSFMVDNTLGNADFMVLSISGLDNFKMEINWGDGSSVDTYSGSNYYYLTMPHLFISYDTFNVTIQIDNILSVNLFHIEGLGGSFLLSADVRNLKNVNNMFFAAGSIKSINISNNKLLQNLDIGQNSLTTNNVNYILHTLVQNNINNGLLNIGLQTPPAPPTGQGITDAEILTSRNWTVITD